MQPILRRLTFLGILLVSLGWIGLSSDPGGSSTYGSIPAPQQGFLAPDFTLLNLEGESMTLSEQRGNAVLVNLWATWCPPCRAEMPAIQKMYAFYKDQGFVVMAVNVTNQDDRDAILPFSLEYALTFPLLLDVGGQVSSLYELRSLPSSFFIDRQGIVQEVVIGGPMSEALLQTRIERILE